MDMNRLIEFPPALPAHIAQPVNERLYKFKGCYKRCPDNEFCEYCVSEFEHNSFIEKHFRNYPKQ